MRITENTIELSRADDWRPWIVDGYIEYEKMEIDVLLDTGEVFYVCWPNAGVAHQLYAAKNEDREIKGGVIFWGPSCHEKRFEDRLKGD